MKSTSKTPSYSNRNGKIDLLKFLFSMVILAHHGNNLIGDHFPFAKGGSLAVEFFFIVSGYLMMESLRKKPALTEFGNLGTETRLFLWKKIKGFYPEMLLAYILAFVCYFLSHDIGLGNLLRQSFEGLLLLDMSGISVKNINPSTWYLSSMLISMAILYPLLRKYPDFTINIILPLSVLFIFGHFCANKTSPRNPRAWWVFTTKGNLRAFAELSIGICLNVYCNFIKKQNLTPNRLCRILLTVIEYTIYFSFIAYMYHRSASREDYWYVLILCIAIAISFSKQGIDAPLFDNKLCFWLGKYSFSIFLCHHFWSTSLGNFLPDYLRNKLKFACYVAISMVTALAVMYASDWIRKRLPQFCSRLRNLFFITDCSNQTNE